MSNRLRALIGGMFLFQASQGAGDAEAGSGFVVRSQSAATLGMAQAGMSTGAGDVATVIYNPATLATGTGSSIGAGITGIVTRGNFETAQGRTAAGTPIVGGAGGNNTASAPLPNLHVGFDLADGLRGGLSLTSLYGLGTYYDDGFAGRYYALDSELISIAAQPSLAWQALPWLALGAGVTVQYSKVVTTAAVDFGTVDAILTGGAFGGVPGASDGRLRVEGSDVTLGMNVGVLVQPLEGTTIGVGYRSAMTHDMDGDATFELGGPVGVGLAAATGAFRSTGVSTELRLPAHVFVGVQQELGRGVTLYGEVNWLGWSRLEDLTLRFDNPAQPDAPTLLPWKDSIFVALGVAWAMDERLTLRGGAAFDQSAARGGGATPAIPDGNALWLSAGAQYCFGDRLALDLAIGATVTEQVRVDLSSTAPGNSFRGDFSGTVGDAGAAFASVQFTMGF